VEEDIILHRLIQVSHNTNCEIMAEARDLSHLQKIDTGFAAPPVFRQCIPRALPQKKSR
jgi:hypothetical protein